MIGKKTRPAGATRHGWLPDTAPEYQSGWNFIAEGASVIATDLADDKLAGLNAKARKKLDVRSQDNIDALAKEVGALDVLVNCAGYVHQGTIFECTDRDWDFSFDLNVKSMNRMLKAFLPAML